MTSIFHFSEIYEVLYVGKDFNEAWIEKDFIAGVNFGVSDLVAVTHFNNKVQKLSDTVLKLSLIHI